MTFSEYSVIWVLFVNHRCDLGCPQGGVGSEGPAFVFNFTKLVLLCAPPLTERLFEQLKMS